MSVSQTSVIFFGLMIGFIVFITVRGELQAYLNVLGISGSGVEAGLVAGQNGMILGGNVGAAIGANPQNNMQLLCRIDPAACASIGGNPVSNF